jgi:hypothetical protein
MRLAPTLVFCGVLLGLSAVPGHAQDAVETILPDRPGLGDAAHVLGLGVTQLEVGLEVSFGPGANLITLGQSLIRYGMNGFEIRVLPGSVVISDENQGAVDPAVGLKVPLVRGNGPQVSAVLATTLPIGSEFFSAHSTTGAATLIGEFALTSTLGLSLNAGYSFPFEEFDDGSIAVIVTPGVSISGVQGLSAYAGYAGFLMEGEDTHFIEAGLALASNADTQLDLNWGMQIDSRGWFLGAGVAHRWR